MAYFEPVHTYREMTKVVEAFGHPQSRLSFVFIKGNPGIGKTNSFQKKVCPRENVLECNSSAFGLYTWLYDRRNEAVIALDDVENVLETPEGQALFRALCQTDEIKWISWNTAAADQHRIPRKFSTKARVMLFANKLGRKGKNLAAVLDRGHLYHFKPTADEVHSEVLRWQAEGELHGKIDDDVIAFIGGNLNRILRPTFRDYVKATEKKHSGLDWRSSLLAKWNRDPKLTACAEIIGLALAGDKTLATTSQRAALFEKWGHGSRSTYFEYLKKVKPLLGLKRLPKSKPAHLTKTAFPAATASI